MSIFSHFALLRTPHFRTSIFLRPWTSSNPAIAPSYLKSVPTLRLLSSRQTRPTPPRARRKSKPEVEMEKEEFYVVRKGGAIGVYLSFADCQAQAGSSISDVPISVFKGCDLPKKTEDYLATKGLKNAVYTISSTDLKEGLFGKLVQCSLQDPTSSEERLRKRSQSAAEIEDVNPVGSDPSKHAKLDHSEYKSCVLKFDGASKGNPGSSGAGVVVLSNTGNLICNLREGLGTATNNVAEYRALLLGLKYALNKGFERVSVFGDSKLVYMQVQGLWKARHENIIGLHQEVLKLKDQFKSFEIHHVLRDKNTDADGQANLGVALKDGEIAEDEPT